MRVFVAGGTGAVGSRLVPQLVARGHEVTATTSRPDKVGALRALGARAVVVDGLDAAAVGEAVAAAAPDAVVHQMTALGGGIDLRHFDRSFALTNRLRVEGTDHLVAAAAATGALVVAQSYTGWPNERSGGWIKDEEDPLDPDPPAAQRESLAAIRYLEDAVRKADGIVLRYGALYGDAHDPMLETIRRRRFPIIGKGQGTMSFTHLDDAAAAAVLAVERGVDDGVRGVFNIVDDEPAPAFVWLPEVAAAVGAKPPRRVPVWVGRLAGGEVAATWLTSTRGSSNDRAKRDLGLRLRWPSWRQGFREGLAG